MAQLVIYRLPCMPSEGSGVRIPITTNLGRFFLKELLQGLDRVGNRCENYVHSRYVARYK